VFEEGQRLYGEQRFSEAAERWGRAALLQHAPSHAHLSDMLIDGRRRRGQGREASVCVCCGWGGAGLRAQQGRTRPLLRCGAMVLPKTKREGLRWEGRARRRAAALGSMWLDVCYDVGYGGVAQDYAEAVRLYRLAAAQGHADAQINLGHMFEYGKGVAQDYSRGHPMVPPCSRAGACSRSAGGWMHWNRSLGSVRGEALSSHAARRPLEYRRALLLAFVARLVCFRP